MTLLALGTGSPWDIAIIAVVIVLLFGGPKLTELGRSFGQGLAELKKATRDDGEPARSETAVSE